ncbi:MAG: tetratricopeptide repeat protein [Bacteroidaceae bacterium]|nr:tetratricopeptide repeat protein [Bacteroidaceae bacterium]
MSSIRIEKIACNAVSKYIADCRSLVPQIDENDKTPIWDGDIYIYDSEQIKNDNLKGRYPLQVKGRDVETFTEEEKFPARINDLIKFAQEGGCVFFIVQELWDDDNEETKTRIFYKFLDKTEIQKLLSVSNLKETKTIILKPLCTKKSLFVIELNRYLQIKQQGFCVPVLPSLNDLVAYTRLIESELSSCKNTENKKSLLALIESIRAININDELWIDKVIAYSRGVIADSQGIIDEYTIAGWFFVFAQFCDEIAYYRYSEKYYYKSLNVCQQYVTDDWQTYLPNVANILSNLGNLHVKTREYDLAESELMEALSQFQKLTEVSPNKYIYFVALAYNNLGEYYRESKSYKEAETAIIKAVQMRRELNLQPTVVSKFDLACSLNNLGLVYLYTNRYDECIKELKEALELFQSLPEVDLYWEKISTVLLNLGNAYSCLKDYDNSKKTYLAALQIDEQLTDKYPSLYEERIAQDLNNLSKISRIHGDKAEVLSQLDEAISIYRKLTQNCFEAYALNLVEVLRNFAIINSELNNNDKAVSAFEEAIEICRMLSVLSPIYFGDDLIRILKSAISFFVDLNDYNRVESLIKEGSYMIKLMYTLKQEDKSMEYKIDKLKLVDYVKKNKIVYQKAEELIETIDEQQFQTLVEVISLMENCAIIGIVNREDMFDSCFKELAEWSTADDVLILVDNEILLCVPKNEYIKLLA